MTKHTTTEIINFIDIERQRTKQVLNEAGFSNDTAINHIVRQYRNALRDYRKIVFDDRADGIETYHK